MPVATKTVKCPSCGAKTPAGADRCRICTRNLPPSASPSQAAYEEALYSSPVRGSAVARTRRKLWPLLVVVIAGLLVWNYLELGYGPAWAHRAEAHQPGDNWRTFRGIDGVTVYLPGEPIVESTGTAAGHLERARVGIDDHWDAILDAGVLSSGARREAESNLDATLAVGEAAAPSDIESAAPALVAGLIPGADLSEMTLTQGAGAFGGADYQFTAAFAGYPDKGSHGTVRARLVVVDDHTYLAATFFHESQDTDLSDRLLEGFTPDAAPGASAAGG
jgi:hypothetical protein